jgi:hypothetical protein
VPDARRLRRNTDAPAASTDSPAPHAAGLIFDAVEGLTTDRFIADPNCRIGKWDTNSTGMDEVYRSDVAEFKQFDCYRSEEDLVAQGQELPVPAQQGGRGEEERRPTGAGE